MTRTTSTAPTSHPAATVVIFRDGPIGQPPEILMTVRSQNMAFAGGKAVFPGGRVDEADFDLAQQLASQFALDQGDLAHRIGAVRETLEETGLALGLRGMIDSERAKAARAVLLDTGTLVSVLTEFGWSLDPAQLTPFARWQPVHERVKRNYDTRFYLANLGTGAVELETDQSENIHLFWTSAQGALDTAARGGIKIIYPTRRNLERLAQFGSFAEARAQAEAIPVRKICPYVDTSGTVPVLRIPDDAGYPVTSEPLDNVIRG